MPVRAQLPERATAVIGLMAPALLAALVPVNVAGAHWAQLDLTTLGGLGAAAAARYLRAPLSVTVLAGMLAAALRAW